MTKLFKKVQNRPFDHKTFHEPIQLVANALSVEMLTGPVLIDGKVQEAQYADLVNDDGKSVIDPPGPDTARRLASCWNACVGLRNPALVLPLMSALRLFLQADQKIQELVRNRTYETTSREVRRRVNKFGDRRERVLAVIQLLFVSAVSGTPMGELPNIDPALARLAKSLQLVQDLYADVNIVFDGADIDIDIDIDGDGDPGEG